MKSLIRDAVKVVFGFSVAMLVVSAFAYAASHTFSGTINTPSVFTWADGGESQIEPFATIGTFGPIYQDSSTGYIWQLKGEATSSPVAVGFPLENGIHYVASSCTGTAYLQEADTGSNGLDGIPDVVHTMTNGTVYYAMGSPASVTTYYVLGFDGVTCSADTESTNLFEGVGPLTPPTLPSGPWHVEAD